MNSKHWFLLIICIIVVFLLVAIAYYFLKNKRSNKLKRRIANFTANKKTNKKY
ncbi:MAG: hypothetical protein PHF21_03465 [Bacilli bacterium]|nr:hypothetical protein [Bacilli bacterium]